MTRDDVIVCSLEPWDEVWRRNQYLVDGLLRADESLRVLFVEPAADMLHSVVSGRKAVRGRGLSTVPGYGGRLHVFEPTKVLPRALGGAADALLRRSVERAARAVGMRDRVLWVNDPGWAMLVRRESSPALYDITDDWLQAQRSSRERARLVANEDTLFLRCEEVVVCSPGLAATRSRRRTVTLIPNAVDVERYRTPAVRPVDMPDAPTALYVGTLHEDRLDIDLVRRTAVALRAVGGTVVLVGPNALSPENSDVLASHKNIRLLGPRPATRVPAYLQHASVLIVPHVVDPFTESLDPIKLYEYRAVGRPIVSTRVAGFRDHTDDGVDLGDARSFPGIVARVAAEERPSRVVEGVPDWSTRVAEFAQVLDRVRGR